MTVYYSNQRQKEVDGKLMNKPDGGGAMEMRRAYFKVSTALTTSDTIELMTIKPGERFNPADARVHWDAGTTNANLDLGHAGFSQIQDSGVVEDIAADADEFLVDGDLGAANLGGSNLLNARAGGIYVADRNAAGVKQDGLVIVAALDTAGMPLNQELILEVPVYKS